MASSFPSADVVAAAIVTASREMRADPIRVASGERDIPFETGKPMVYETSRARAYAAWALKTEFPGAGHVALGRLVGSGSPAVYLSSLAKTRAHADWWDPEVYRRVKEAVQARSEEAGPSPPPKLEPAPVPRAAPASGQQMAEAGPGKAELPAFLPPRPVTTGKRKLLEDLAAAVRNTARLPVRD